LQPISHSLDDVGRGIVAADRTARTGGTTFLSFSPVGFLAWFGL
jgi:hypothetical protein